MTLKEFASSRHQVSPKAGPDAWKQLLEARFQMVFSRTVLSFATALTTSDRQNSELLAQHTESYFARQCGFAADCNGDLPHAFRMRWRRIRGRGITSLSASSVVLDAGQSVSITATLSGEFTVQWAFSGTSCSGAACGTLSATTGSAVTYTAPSGITAPMQLTLVAAIPNTKNQETVSITVNPDPTLSGVPPGDRRRCV